MTGTTRKRMQPNPKKLRSEDIVVSTVHFTGRKTPPPPANVRDPGPFSLEIPEGTQGIIWGRVQGTDDLFDVEFDVRGEFRRVEAYPYHIALLQN